VSGYRAQYPDQLASSSCLRTSDVCTVKGEDEGACRDEGLVEALEQVASRGRPRGVNVEQVLIGRV
jgi:hypothetical protein